MKRVKRHEKTLNNLKRNPDGMIFVGVADSSSRGGGRMLWVVGAVRLHHKKIPSLQGLVRGCIVTESDGPNADLNKVQNPAANAARRTVN